MTFQIFISLFTPILFFIGTFLPTIPSKANDKKTKSISIALIIPFIACVISFLFMGLLGDNVKEDDLGYFLALNIQYVLNYLVVYFSFKHGNKYLMNKDKNVFFKIVLGYILFNVFIISVYINVVGLFATSFTFLGSE